MVIPIPQVYLKREIYDELILKHRNPTDYINNLAEKALKAEKEKKVIKQ